MCIEDVEGLQARGFEGNYSCRLCNREKRITSDPDPDPDPDSDTDFPDGQVVTHTSSQKISELDAPLPVSPVQQLVESALPAQPVQQGTLTSEEYHASSQLPDAMEQSTNQGCDICSEDREFLQAIGFEGNYSCQFCIQAERTTPDPKRRKLN